MVFRLGFDLYELCCFAYEFAVALLDFFFGNGGGVVLLSDIVITFLSKLSGSLKIIVDLKQI